jgi:hypothetical protein
MNSEPIHARDRIAMRRRPKDSLEEPNRTTSRTRHHGHHVIVLPAFNEGAVIRKVIHDIASALDAGRNSYKIILCARHRLGLVRRRD